MARNSQKCPPDPTIRTSGISMGAMQELERALARRVDMEKAALRCWKECEREGKPHLTTSAFQEMEKQLRNLQREHSRVKDRVFWNERRLKRKEAK